MSHWNFMMFSIFYELWKLLPNSTLFWKLALFYVLYYHVYFLLFSINQNYEFKVMDDLRAHNVDKFGDCENKEVFSSVFINFDLTYFSILAYDNKNRDKTWFLQVLQNLKVLKLSGTIITFSVKFTFTGHCFNWWNVKNTIKLQTARPATHSLEFLVKIIKSKRGHIRWIEIMLLF